MSKSTPSLPHLKALILWGLLILAPFSVLGAVNAAHGPSHHELATTCSRHCHDRGCVHNREKYDWSAPGPAAARAVYFANIRALRATPLGYQNTNLLVYVLLAPLLAAGLLLFILWPRAGTPHPARGYALVGFAMLVGACGLVMAAHVPTLVSWGSAYWFCTDFCIHAANLLGITYEELNFALFVLGFPLTVLGLMTSAGWRAWRDQSSPSAFASASSR